MFCKQCKKGILLRQHKIVNNKDTEVYYDSLEQAENYFENMIEEYPNMDWKLSELLICNDCNFVEEKILKTKRIEEIGNA